MTSAATTPEFILLVGLPASGKSTFARKLEKEGYQIHSSDALRRELFGDEECQADNNRIFEELARRVKRDLLAGRSCVMDSTNLSRRRRLNTLRNLPNIPVKKICLLFVTPVDVLKTRDDERCRHVGSEVMYRMLCRFECPYNYEGWDEIRQVSSGEEYTYPRNETLDFSQDNPHHVLTLGGHMESAHRYTIEHDFSEEVQIAAFWHDCGKLYTKTFRNMKGEATDTAHYYGHENYSTYLFLADALSGSHYRYGSWERTLYIANLINWHMRPMNAWDNSPKARAKDRELMGEQMYGEILQLHEADLAAH